MPRASSLHRACTGAWRAAGLKFAAVLVDERYRDYGEADEALPVSAPSGDLAAAGVADLPRPRVLRVQGQRRYVTPLNLRLVSQPSNQRGCRYRDHEHSGGSEGIAGRLPAEGWGEVAHSMAWHGMAWHGIS